MIYVNEAVIRVWLVTNDRDVVAAAIRAASAKSGRTPVRALNTAHLARDWPNKKLTHWKGCGMATLQLLQAAMARPEKPSVQLSIEECVYWGIIHYGAAWYYAHEIWRDIVERDLPMLRDRMHKSLDDAYRRDSNETQGVYERTQREAMFCWWLCRQAIGAIKRERPR